MTTSGTDGSPFPVSKTVLTLIEIEGGKVELIDGNYSAHQSDGNVVILATGGTQLNIPVYFMKSHTAVFPPEFSLFCIVPSKIIKSPASFSLYQNFPASEPVTHVVVHDRSGRHEIKVEQNFVKIAWNDMGNA